MLFLPWGKVLEDIVETDRSCREIVDFGIRSISRRTNR